MCDRSIRGLLLNDSHVKDKNEKLQSRPHNGSAKEVIKVEYLKNELEKYNNMEERQIGVVDEKGMDLYTVVVRCEIYACTS